MSNIEIKTTKKYGRGLYATKTIQKGEIVEISPIVELYGKDHQATTLNMYIFEWRGNSSALALGLGSLFNHSKRFNIAYNPVFRNRNIIFVATKKIKRGNQLFIDYGYDPKHGIEVTERNVFTKLKEKFEPKQERVNFGLTKEKPMERARKLKGTLNSVTELAGKEIARLEGDKYAEKDQDSQSN